MRALILGLMLSLAASQAQGQVAAFKNVELDNRTDVDDPMVVTRELEGEWMAFVIPAQAGTRSPCCWKGSWNARSEVGCSLKEGHHNQGTRSDSPVADHLVVISRSGGSQKASFRVVGEHCPVDAGGERLTWLGAVDSQKGLQWLERQVHVPDEASSHGALMAIALHAEPSASDVLENLAAGQDRDLAKNSIFWLGEARGTRGYRSLEHLLGELEAGEVRRQINFALAQNDSDEARELLATVAETDKDREQRSDALFWLAQSYPREAERILVEVLDHEKDREVLDQAIFALSQLPDHRGDELLLDIVRDGSYSKGTRQQALFWLTQSDSDETLAKLEKMLTSK